MQGRTDRRPNQTDSRSGGGRPGGRFGGRSAGRPSGAGRPSRGFRDRKRQNRFYTVFSAEQTQIDYKETEKLSRFLTEKGKIIPRRITGLTAKQQRLLAHAIKRARHAGLLAFQVD